MNCSGSMSVVLLVSNFLLYVREKVEKVYIRRFQSPNIILEGKSSLSVLMAITFSSSQNRRSKTSRWSKTNW